MGHMGLHLLQTGVHVAKNKVNEFGGYNYRTAEGILAAIKSALPDGATITVTDDLRELAGQIFVSSTATVTFADGASHNATGHAMHPLTKKGMDPSQITGSASSYARKYALTGLMAIDDGSADPDADKKPYEPEPVPPFDAKAAADRVISKLSRQTTEEGLDEAYREERETRGSVKEANEEQYQRILGAAKTMKAKLATGKETTQ